MQLSSACIIYIVASAVSFVVMPAAGQSCCSCLPMDKDWCTAKWRKATASVACPLPTLLPSIPDICGVEMSRQIQAGHHWLALCVDPAPPSLLNLCASGA